MRRKQLHGLKKRPKKYTISPLHRCTSLYLCYRVMAGLCVLYLFTVHYASSIEAVAYALVCTKTFTSTLFSCREEILCAFFVLMRIFLLEVQSKVSFSKSRTPGVSSGYECLYKKKGIQKSVESLCRETEALIHAFKRCERPVTERQNERWKNNCASVLFFS